jgi:NAD-dependent deacetylase
MDDIDKFKSALKKSNRIVGFTGAGISTESGIPDYRSQGGIWDKFQPVYLDEFISDESKRLLYWQRKKSLWQGIRDARLSKTHIFFKELYDNGKLLGLITQNIDGLHEKSGLSGDVIINIHGTNLEVICLECKDITPAHETLDDLNLDNGAPLCTKCAGLLKPNTISFGQNLIQEDLKRAEELALSCDLMIAAGSTLVVQPAASFPLIAKKNGAILAIITLSDTPLDNNADFVFHEKLGDFIDRLAN